MHDVVGHSLTVILAQAQSAHYLDNNLNPDVRNTLTAIANTARSSLRDVRSILVATQEGEPEENAGVQLAAMTLDVETLIEDVKKAGAQIMVTTQGRSRSLAPDSSTTLYRVLQEMLTNVLKHGGLAESVTIDLDWRSGLVVTTVNGIPGSDAGDERNGAGESDDTQDETRKLRTRGLAGMRSRMEAVGGRLEVERSPTAFLVRAVFPVSGVMVEGRQL